MQSINPLQHKMWKVQVTTKPRRGATAGWEMSGPHETLQHLTPAPRQPASMVFAT